jgi:hypothetical protein
VKVSEWEDPKSKKVVARNWNLKYIPMVTCVDTSKKHVISCVIMLQESENLQEAVRKRGIEFARDLTLQ